MAPTTRMTPTPSRAIGTRCSLIDLGSPIFGALIDGSLRPGGLGCSTVGTLGGDGVAAAGAVGVVGIGSLGVDGADGIDC